MTETPRPEPNRSRGHSREAATARQAPRALWLIAQAFLTVLHTLFGAPEDLARQHTLTYKAYARVAPWLRAGEALLRKLLVIEASFYGKPNTRPLLRQPRRRVSKLMVFTPDAPEQWRVSFRCFVGDTHARQTSRHMRRRPERACVSPTKREDRWSYENFKPVTFRSAWTLAERYEALLRAFNDQAPYARRLARRLYAAPHRVRIVLRSPPGAADLVGAPNLALVCAGAEAAGPRFDST